MGGIAAARAGGREGSALSRPPASRRARRWGLRLGAGALALALLAGLGAWAVLARIDWIELAPRDRDPDTVYLFVGADAGIARDPSDVQFTEDADAPARADVLLLVRLGASGEASAVSVPRDVVATGIGRPIRLALTLLDGPQLLVDGVCGGLGVEVDRVVVIDGRGFAELVDAVGGIEVDIPAPLRDPAAGLRLDEAGLQRLDGAAALALVRSRHAETLVDGAWAAQDEAGGAVDRAAWSGLVLDRVRAAIGDAAPWTLVRAAWAASSGVSIGGGLHPAELLRLAGAEVVPSVLPTRTIGDGLPRVPGDDGEAALREAGFDTGCRAGAAGATGRAHPSPAPTG